MPKGWKRSWVKFWVSECLDGSIREEMDPAERGVWYDLIIFSARCRLPGVISSNETQPISRWRLAGILNVPEELLNHTIDKCVASERIKIDDNGLLHIVNWSKYQSESDRVRAYQRGKSISPKAKGKVELSNDNFEEFWKEYPRKEARVKAGQAFKSLNPSEKLLEIILADISSRKQSEAWQKDGGKYIPLPATYLRGKRWEDETKKEAPNGNDRRHPEERYYTDPNSYRIPVILSTDPAILKLHEDLKGEKPHPPDG